MGVGEMPVLAGDPRCRGVDCPRVATPLSSVALGPWRGRFELMNIHESSLGYSIHIRGYYNIIACLCGNGRCVLEYSRTYIVFLGKNRLGNIKCMLLRIIPGPHYTTDIRVLALLWQGRYYGML